MEWEPKNPKKPRLSGYQKLRKAGKRAVLLAITEEQLFILRGAAEKAHRSVANFVVHELFKRKGICDNGSNSC